MARTSRNTLAHFLHDAGLAIWFGGSLMGAVGVNGAARDVDDPRQRARVATQRGVLGNTGTKLALTAGALGATAYARVLGQKMMNAGDVPVAGGTESTAATPPEVAKAQKQLHALQWAIPALTGGILASSSLHEEQQKPSEQLRNTVLALPSTVAGAARGAAGAAGAAGTAAGAAALAAGSAAAQRVREAV